MTITMIQTVCTFAEELEEEYLDMGQDVEFAKGTKSKEQLPRSKCSIANRPSLPGLSVLRNQLTIHVKRTKAELRQRKKRLWSRTPNTSTTEEVPDIVAPTAPENPISHLGDTLTRYATDDAYMELDGGPELQEAWSSLWTDDLSNFYLNDINQDMLSAYLLGLPQTEKDSIM